jgi:hypothetical protein
MFKRLFFVFTKGQINSNIPFFIEHSEKEKEEILSLFILREEEIPVKYLKSNIYLDKLQIFCLITSQRFIILEIESQEITFLEIDELDINFGNSLSPTISIQNQTKTIILHTNGISEINTILYYVSKVKDANLYLQKKKQRLEKIAIESKTKEFITFFST